MTRLASRFGRINQIRRDRALTHEELMNHVPSVFGSDKHESRSDRYTYIPTITILESLQREGFEPFFACQTKVRDLSKREHTKHMLRLRRAGQLTGHQVPEIILLNSHDGSSSYQMLPGLFRGVCTNGLVCGQSFGDVRVPHKGNVVEKVIEGAYEVLGVFDRVEEKRDAMQSLLLPPPAQQAMAKAALTYRFGEEHQPVTESQILSRAAGRMRVMTCGPLTSVFRKTWLKVVCRGERPKASVPIPEPLKVSTAMLSSIVPCG